MLINFRNILEVTIKDLKSFFDGLYGYILIVIFLAISYFIFLQSFFIVGNASLQQLFGMLPLYMIVFIPAITMGSFARESDRQTLEYVLTKPLRTIEVVLGKIFASTIFAYSAILLTLPLYFTISRAGRIDGGETFAGYLGSFLLVLALSSLGVAVSSFFRNQISAFLVTCFVIFGLYIVQSPLGTANLPVSVANTISAFAINNYYANLIRGVIDLGDLLFLLLFSFIGIVVTKVSIDRFRIATPVKLIQNSILIVLASTLFVFWMMYLSKNYEYRVDVTQSKKYTLSEVSKKAITTTDKVKIEVYASSGLPQQFQYSLDELKSQLKSFQDFAGGNIEVQYLDPEGKEAELTALGIRPSQFNVIGNDQFQTKQGYLGLVVKNEAGNKTEVIPFIQDINNLEFQVVRLINKVLSKEPSKLAYASGNGEYSNFENYQAFSQLLGDNFTVETIYIPGVDVSDEKKADQKPFSLEGYAGLIIANPTIRYTPEALNTIKDFLNKGGKVVFTVDSKVINLEQGAIVSDYDEGISAQTDLFADLGIKVNSDMVYDLKSRASVTLTNQVGLPLTVQYPYYPMIARDYKFIDYAPESIMAEWPSSLEITDTNAWKVLYRTSDRSGSTSSNFNLDPMQTFSQDNLKSYPIIALREFDNGGKLIVSANARMLTNEYLANSESNVIFALSLSESISNNAGLAQIRAKNLYNSQFTGLDETAKSMIRFGSPIMSIVLLGLIGASRIIRKKLLATKLATQVS